MVVVPPALQLTGGGGHWDAPGAKSPTWDLLLLFAPLLPFCTPCGACPVALGQRF